MQRTEWTVRGNDSSCNIYTRHELSEVSKEMNNKLFVTFINPRQMLLDYYIVFI